MDFYDVLFAKKLNGGGGDGSDIPEVDVKDVNFFDYDGKCLHSYTFNEWANVTELPQNPSHDGLTAQGWNWTKAEIDAQVLAIPGFPVHVGQHYVTTSGNTEIDIKLEAPNLSPYLCLGINGSVDVDWGDGNTQTLTGTNRATNINTKHNYSSEGYYTISIKRNSGSCSLSNTNAGNSKSLLNNNSSTENANIVYNSRIIGLRIGDLNGGEIGPLSLKNTYNCITMTVPQNLVLMNSSLNSTSLRCIVVPRTFTGSTITDVFANSQLAKTICLPPTTSRISFNGCRSLVNVTPINGATYYKPSSVGSMASCASLAKVYVQANTDAFLCRYNYSLGCVIIASNVTSIGSTAFGDNYALKEVHLKPTTPPILASSIFTNTPSGMVIYVPYSDDHSVLDAYQTATNWSTYASQMVEES